MPHPLTTADPEYIIVSRLTGALRDGPFYSHSTAKWALAHHNRSAGRIPLYRIRTIQPRD